ncbi:MAG: type restriction enzyme subunit, partial [Acidobacteriota bacterium]|nr:type restriction enzyme subunit [Acidobacteriota bacterium]
MSNEADTCRRYVTPKLVAAGWDDEPHSFTEQRTFTDGRIVPVGNRVIRRPGKRADYLLRYTRDFLLAVVEAKPEFRNPGDGLQQAKDYAEILGLKFAYSTNGHGIVEFDYLTGEEKELDAFPSPAQLWQRLRPTRPLDNETETSQLLAPYYHQAGKSP